MPTDVETQSTNKQSPPYLRALPERGDVLIAAAQVPEFIGIQRQTMAKWRCDGAGPKFVRLGRRVFYRSSDLREWIDAQVRQNTIAA